VAGRRVGIARSTTRARWISRLRLVSSRPGSRSCHPSRPRRRSAPSTPAHSFRKFPRQSPSPPATLRRGYVGARTRDPATARLRLPVKHAPFESFDAGHYGDGGRPAADAPRPAGRPSARDDDAARHSDGSDEIRHHLGPRCGANRVAAWPARSLGLYRARADLSAVHRRVARLHSRFRARQGHDAGTGRSGSVGFAPSAIESSYGSRHPVGGTVFLRIRPTRIPMSHDMEGMQGMRMRQ